MAQPSTPAAVAPSALSSKSSSIVDLGNSTSRSAPPVNNAPPKNPDSVVNVNDIEDDGPSQPPPTQQQESVNTEGEAPASPVAEPNTTPTFDIPDASEDGKSVDVSGQPNAGTPQADGTIPEGPRNYQDYPANLQPILRALNNSQFKKYAPELKKLHEQASRVPELEAKLAEKPRKPEFFYEQPDAYRLDPQFQKLETDLNYDHLEQHAWQQALLAIKRGEAWQCPTGYDEQGRMKYQKVDPLPNGVVDSEAEVQVMAALSRATNNIVAHNNQLQQFKGQYTAQVSRAQEELKALDARIFPKIQNEADYTPQDKQYVSYVDGLLPAQFKNHPLTGFLRKMSVFSGRALAYAEKKTAEAEKYKAILENRSVAGPTTLKAGGGAPSANGKAEDRVVVFNTNTPE